MNNVKAGVSSLLILILFIFGCREKRFVIQNKDEYGYWFPQNIKWGNDESSNKVSQFSFYYFDTRISTKNWATITYESRIDSYTIAVNRVENIIRIDNPIIDSLNFQGNKELEINGKEYYNLHNVRE